MTSQPSPMQQQIQTKIAAQLSPVYIEVINESQMHGGPATESHFKVTVVSEAFNSERLLARHRRVNKVLADELANSIHALALHTYTPDEWAQRNGAPASPACRGGE